MTAKDINSLPYRPCVGIMLLNAKGHLWAGERLDNPGAWQMPQGGIDPGEAEEAAAFRELEEETSIPQSAVTLLGNTEDWITYDLPPELVGKLWKGRYRGQKQKWFAMRFDGPDDLVDLDTSQPEFSAWRWMTPTKLMPAIVPFKRHVYDQVLQTFARFLA